MSTVEIAIHNALRVRVLQRVDQLLEYRQPSAPPITARAASRPLPTPLQTANLQTSDRGDIRMIERRQHVRFALESRHAVGILRRFWAGLDGCIAIDLGMGIAIYRAPYHPRQA